MAKEKAGRAMLGRAGKVSRGQSIRDVGAQQVARFCVSISSHPI